MKTKRTTLAFVLLSLLIMSPVSNALEITTLDLPSGRGGLPYSATLTATNGTPPYTWSISPTIVAWDGNGQIDIPAAASNAVAVSAGGHNSLALQSNGTVFAWGEFTNGKTNVPQGLSNVVAISAGDTFDLALKSNGTVAAWGDNHYGQTNVPTGLSNVVAVASAWGHAVALKSNGTVVAWGQSQHGETSVPPGLSNVTAIACGWFHSLAIISNGAVVAWGSNTEGETDVPPGLSNVVAVAGDYRYSLALKSDGTVVAWGRNERGQTSVPVGLSNVVAIAAGFDSSIAVQSGGTVILWGNQTNVPAGLNNVVMVDANRDHAIALRPPMTQLPNGLSCNTAGVLSGTPAQAGTNLTTFVVQDSLGASASKVLQIVIQPNQIPAIDAATPPQGAANMFENRSQAFSVTAHDPEGQALSYAWTWNGSPVGGNSSNYTYFAPWGTISTSELKCAISDGWNTNVSHAVWQVEVQDIPMEISTPTMPNGTEMVVYSTTVSATNGVIPYSWTASNLPGGLACSANGVVFGTPTLAGTNMVSFIAHDALGASTNKELQIEIMPNPSGRPAVIHSNAPLAGAVSINEGDGQIFTVWATDPEGSNLIYTWEWDGALVGGNTDIYTHTTAWGDSREHTLRCTVADEFWTTNVYVDWSVTVEDLPIEITTSFLPSGTEMVPYSEQLGATNGVAPYGWGIQSGNLSPGLSLSSSGVISGTPTMPTNAPVAFMVYDSAGAFTNIGFVLNIAANANTRPVLFSKIPTTNSVSLSETNELLFQALGYDPEGLDLIYNWRWNGVSVGSNSASFRYVAAWGDAGLQSLRCYLADDLWINEVYAEWTVDVEQVQRVITTAAMPSGMEMVSYSAWLVATNGAEPFSWTIGADAPLPAGLTCSTDGHVMGLPTVAGNYNTRFIAEDAVGVRISKTMSIVIAANSNLRPFIYGRSPDANAASMNEATSKLFRAYAYDPEAVELTYAWTWDGVGVGDNSDRYTHTTDWGDAGLHTLRCYASDDLWVNVVYAQWDVTVVDDNDGDGMSNGQEIDLGRDPNDPNDGGGPSILSGTVSGGGVPVADAYVELRGAGGKTYQRILTEDGGAYVIGGIQPGHYYIKAGADRYKDEWFEQAAHRSNAVAVAIAPTTRVNGFDFDLAPGQNLALVSVSSDPSGAKIYLDYQPTPYVTPAVLSVGEVASQAIRVGPASHSIWVGSGIASHVISVRKTSRPRPTPVAVTAAEAETVAQHFDLTADGAGSVTISTQPGGAEIYVDLVEEPEGITPVIVGNLAPGSHTILLRARGYLQPRPVVARVEAGETTAVEIPLASSLSPDRIVADVRSSPANARVFVDYLPIVDVTDVVVDWMDPASHAGSGWHSASHTIMLRQPGKLEGAPRYVPETSNVVHAMSIHLEVDPASEIDSSGDGIPDWIWAAYGFDPQNPPDANSDDGSGMSYKDKIRAGLVPGDPNSRFAVEDVDMVVQPGSQTLTFVFGTVPGRRYVVQSAESADGEWSNLGGLILATQYQTSYAVQVAEDGIHRFYRLMVLVP